MPWTGHCNPRSLTVRNYGRGSRFGKLVDCVSIFNADAKYDSETFQKAVGQKAVNALSLNYRAQAIREGETKVVEFEKAELKSESAGTGEPASPAAWRLGRPANCAVRSMA